MKERKEVALYVRVTRQEKEQIERQAAAEHMTISQYIRWLALRDRKRE